MDRAMEYDGLCGAFLKDVPELRSELETGYSQWATDGPHIFFGQITAEVLPVLIADEQRNGDLLLRIFNFFERVASQGDDKVRGVIGLSVCQEICGNEVLLQKSKKYWGPNTRMMCDKLIAGDGE